MDLSVSEEIKIFKFIGFFIKINRINGHLFCKKGPMKDLVLKTFLTWGWWGGMILLPKLNFQLQVNILMLMSKTMYSYQFKTSFRKAVLIFYTN